MFKDLKLKTGSRTIEFADLRGFAAYAMQERTRLLRSPNILSYYKTETGDPELPLRGIPESFVVWDPPVSAYDRSRYYLIDEEFRLLVGVPHDFLVESHGTLGKRFPNTIYARPNLLIATSRVARCVVCDIERPYEANYRLCYLVTPGHYAYWRKKLKVIRSHENVLQSQEIRGLGPYDDFDWIKPFSPEKRARILESERRDEEMKQERIRLHRLNNPRKRK